MSIAPSGNHIESVQVDRLHCMKCEWRWTPRKAGELPKVCPHCKSRQYDRAKIPNVGRKKKVDLSQIGSE